VLGEVQKDCLENKATNYMYLLSPTEELSVNELEEDPAEDFWKK
jgi:hypothetical protein